MGGSEVNGNPSGKKGESKDKTMVDISQCDMKNKSNVYGYILNISAPRK
jgi:hypothetical protein